MGPDDHPLSGYLLARAALGRTIDDTPEIRKEPDGAILRSEKVLQDLRAANASLEITRRLLPHGRGNVKEDILATGGEASRRYTAGSRLRESYTRKEFGGSVTGILKYQMVAAVGLFTGQAACGPSAALAAHIHAPRLERDQTLVAIGNSKIGHAWAEAWRGTDPDNDVILDRWTSGPAILKQDSRYGLEPEVEKLFALDYRNRSRAVLNMVSMSEEIRNDPGLKAEFEASMKHLEQTNHKILAKVWDEESVMGESFRKRAGARLHAESAPLAQAERGSSQPGQAPRPPFTLELLAAGVARSLGEGVKGAVTKAPGIVATAKDMFPKPSDRRAGPSRT
jgi:hypothetical protein